MKNELPSLPRVLKKREASVTPKVLNWFATHYMGCAAIEIKATKKGNIPASAVLPHQAAALFDAGDTGIVHKLSDEARRRQPFDAFKIAYARGFVVCCFLTERKALVIDIEEWEGATPETNCFASFEI